MDLLDPLHRAIAKKDVAAVFVVRIHLVGMAERVVGRVNDHLWMIVNVGPAMAANQISAAVGVGRQAGLGPDAGERNDAVPGVVGDGRRSFAEEDRVRQSIRHAGHPCMRVLVERAVDDVSGKAVGHGFGNVHVIANTACFGPKADSRRHS